MTLESTMDAIVITKPGGPEVLELQRVPRPAPGAGEVLIEVHAAGVNRPDLMQRLGKYPPPPGASLLPGLEVAGRVVALGAGVTRWQVGDAVCALVAGGGYAEYCAAPAGQCLAVPPALDMCAAAALPETYFTVWTNLFDGAHLAAGDVVLVHGGASGIGTTAIQMARMAGARVIVTAGSDAKCEACRQLGAEHAINYRADDFADVIPRLTSGAGVDVVLDMIGGEYLLKNLTVLAPRGRLVQIAVMHGAVTPIDLRLVMQKRLIVTGSTLRPRSVAEKTAIRDALEATVWPRLAAGELAPVIDSTVPLARAGDAHRRLEGGEHVGKVVLQVR